MTLSSCVSSASSLDASSRSIVRPRHDKLHRHSVHDCQSTLTRALELMSDGDYEEIEEEERVEELVVLRIPALLAASSANMRDAKVSLTGFNTAAPQLHFAGAGYSFQGRWAGIPRNAAVVGLERIPPPSETVTRLDDRQLLPLGDSAADGDAAKNPQSMEEMRRRELQLVEKQHQALQTQDVSVAATSARFAPTLTQRFRPVETAAAAAVNAGGGARHDPDETSNRQPRFAVNGLGAPSRMIYFETSGRGMAVLADEERRRALAQQKVREQERQRDTGALAKPTGSAHLQ